MLAPAVSSRMSLIVDRRIVDIGTTFPTMDIRERLGLNLRRLRQEKSWSQEDLAHESGLHRTYISDLERIARNPTITVVERLAQTLGVKVGELLD